MTPIPPKVDEHEAVGLAAFQIYNVQSMRTLNPRDSSSETGFSTAEIIGVVVGCLAFILIFSLLFFDCMDITVREAKQRRGDPNPKGLLRTGPVKLTKRKSKPPHGG